MQFTSASGWCNIRKIELGSLGASAVICIILDPVAREKLWKIGQVEEGANNDFGEAMRSVNDNYIYQELNRALAVFVECGDPLALVQSVRRQLDLSTRGTSPLAVSGTTARDIIRARFQKGSGAFAYIGVSTGSSIAGEHVFEMSPSEVTSAGGDNSGLGLVPNCSFYPHVLAQDGPQLHASAAVHHTEIMAIPDCQPLFAMGLSDERLSIICP